LQIRATVELRLWFAPHQRPKSIGFMGSIKRETPHWFGVPVWFKCCVLYQRLVANHTNQFPAKLCVAWTCRSPISHRSPLRGGSLNRARSAPTWRMILRTEESPMFTMTRRAAHIFYCSL
jgi:hypothetical protein